MTYHLSVREWPASEQPREKLAQYGPEKLSDAELLAILMRVGVTGQDVVSLSYEVLRRFGGLSGLARTPLSTLAELRGIGPAKAVAVKAALELGHRLVLANAGKPLQIRSPQDVASMLQIAMALLDQEELWVVLLNTKNQVQGEPRHVYRGSLNSSQIRVSEVFRDAVKENSAAIIVVHNHPSGDPTPSPEDARVTRDLVAAGKLLDIDVLDHLVIGRNSYVSLRQKRLGFD
ncbi:MAG TPA: DNA repair protein RadC [Chloroflexota bacterium]|nr:DNA repair protein RadC [Chloroflexota bacterium]